ncbi:MAG: lamin tail domain-containing protein, partial [Dysgonamonadaceae bacterium]|nr:lamin tail domain-containing protein [Dysgonamonadaceae bacterium]
SGGVATDLFFSEYIEGSGNNKYLEIFNGTGAPVNSTDYEVVLYSNGSTERGNSLDLEGTLENGEVIVIANSQAEIYDGEVITSTVTYFNGDDAIALQKISTGDYVDIIGRIGERENWTAEGEHLSTKDKTLVRKPTVRGGVTENPAAGFPTLATEWIGYPIDTADYLGSHTMN